MASNGITARRGFHRVWIVRKKIVSETAPGQRCFMLYLSGAKPLPQACWLNAKLNPQEHNLIKFDSRYKPFFHEIARLEYRPQMVGHSV